MNTNLFLEYYSWLYSIIIFVYGINRSVSQNVFYQDISRSIFDVFFIINTMIILMNQNVFFEHVFKIQSLWGRNLYKLLSVFGSIGIIIEWVSKISHE
jgi:hypothetical protein